MIHTTDLQIEEERRRAWLRGELKPGDDADDSEFLELDADTLLKEAKLLNLNSEIRTDCTENTDKE